MAENQTVDCKIFCRRTGFLEFTSSLTVFTSGNFLETGSDGIDVERTL